MAKVIIMHCFGQYWDQSLMCYCCCLVHPLHMFCSYFTLFARNLKYFQIMDDDPFWGSSTSLSLQAFDIHFFSLWFITLLLWTAVMTYRKSLHRLMLQGADQHVCFPKVKPKYLNHPWWVFYDLSTHLWVVDVQLWDAKTMVNSSTDVLVFFSLFWFVVGQVLFSDEALLAC